ncbi:hypothetical protein BKA69DRAFT_1056561 [Paraphysoderma sedebokerense]|nr:hypothetical protein BKA69DRAFT_1056561 [Paraphysoderma sedebokerense]
MVKLCRFFGLPRDTVLWEIFDRLLSKWYFLACDFEFHFELTMNLVSSLPKNWYKWYNFSTEYALIMLNSTIVDSLLKLMMHRSLKERFKELAADCGSALDYEDLKVGEPVDYEYSEFYDGVSDTTDESASDTSTVCSTTSSSTSSSSASQSSAEHIISYDPTENRSSSPDSTGDSEETLVDSDGQDIKMKGGSEGESPFDPYDVPDLCIHLLEFFEDAKLKRKHKNSIILNLEPIWESLCQKAGPSELVGNLDVAFSKIQKFIYFFSQGEFVSLLLESDLKGKVIKVLTKIANQRIGMLLQAS